MKQVEGWWVPDIMSGAGNYVTRALQLLPHMDRFKGRRVVVQAGGHIGTYPKLLGEHFERVYTFEPEAENFQCLVRNCPGEHIYAARGCLAGKRHTLGLNRTTGKNTGQHQVRPNGPIPAYLIDDLGLDACDMLAIDVEGFEVSVLIGAMKTIALFKPLICAEENKRLLHFKHRYGDIERLLEPLDYRVVDRVGEDIVLQAA